MKEGRAEKWRRALEGIEEQGSGYSARKGSCGRECLLEFVIVEE